MSQPAICRAKYKLTARNETAAGYGLVFEPVTSGSPENERFFKWTPWGKLEMGTVNVGAAKQFEVGREYYLDITPAE